MSWKKLKILSFDLDLDLDDVTCEVFLDDGLIEKLSVEKNAFEINLPIDSILQFRVSNSAGCLLSSAFPVSLLTPTTRFIPLFPYKSSKVFEVLPDSASPPRILVQISESADPEFFPDLCESFLTELEIAGLIRSPGLDSQDYIFKNDFKSKFKKQTIVMQVLSKQLEFSKNNAAQLLEKIAGLEGKILKITEQLAANSQNSHDREEYLLEIIQGKDKEIYEGLCDIMLAQAKIRHIQNENEHLLDKAGRLQIELDRFVEIEKELERANLKLKKAENIQDQLTDTLNRVGKNADDEVNAKSQIALKDQEIQMLKSIAEELKKSGDMQTFSLKMEIEELKNHLAIYQSLEKPAVPILDTSVTEAYFSAALARCKFEKNYCKINDFTYKIQDKTINLALCKSGVFIKSGLSLTSLDDFFQSSLIIRTENSLDPDKDLEKKLIVKAASQKTFLQATRSSLCKIRPVLEKTPIKSHYRLKSSERRPFK